MNFKDKLIKKLVDVGKKHRILVYPMLILVAIISAISHTIYWGKGNGRKLVASVAIVALLITQSLFLTSSADVGDNPAAGNSSAEETTVDIDNSTVDNESNNDDNVNENIGNNEDEITNDEGTADDEGKSGEEEAGSDEKKSGEEGLADEEGTDSEEKTSGIIPDFDDEIGDENDLLAEGLGDVTSVKYNVVYTENGTVKCDYTAGKEVDSEGNADIDASNAKGGWTSYGEDGGVTLSGAFFDSSCTIPVTSVKVSDWDESKCSIEGASVNLYYKATRTKYVVTVTSDGTTVAKTEEVSVTPSDELAGEFTYTVKSASDYSLSKTGYVYQGLSYGSASYTVGQDVTLSGGNYTLNAEWSPAQFTVTYDVNPDSENKINLIGSQTADLTATYDSTLTLPTADDISSMVESKGYFLKGWTPDGGSTIYSPGATLSAEQVNALAIEESSSESGIADAGTGLVAVWEYRNIDLVLTKVSASGSATIGTDTVTGEYGDYVDFNISAKYKDNAVSDGNFSYTISGGEAALTALGLSISETKQGSVVVGYEIKGTFTDINESGAAVTITVNDTNKKSTEGDITSAITIIVNRKQVEIVPSSLNIGGKAVSKVYDADPYITVTDRAEVADKVGSDDVYASFDTQAEIEDANVGSGKALTLKNVSLAGTKKAYYKLVDNGSEVADGSDVTVPGVATITPGAVELGIKLADDSASDTVKFGQASPEYTLYIVNTSSLADDDKTAYEGFSTNAQRENFIKQKIGFTGTYSCSRALYSDPGTYEISPNINSSGANYLATSPKTSFTVTRDSGEGHYELLGEKNNGIYPELQIKATNGYDKIRFADSGDISPADKPKGQAEALFSNVVTVPDMKNGTVKIQMLDSSTGAVSEIVTLDDISVDRNGPKLEAFTVSPNKTYFNEFGFGTYYHAQDINGVKVESVSITFEYSSEGSDCDKFYYEFLDENGNVRGGITHEALMTKNNGRYYATITIGTGTYGELVVSATNLAGNPSARNYIKLNEKLLSMDSYYEWMVENSITGSDIQVVDGDGNPATSGVWYNSLTYKTTATDNDSGLQFMNWTIGYPNGSEETVKENAGATIASISDGGVKDYGKVTGYTFSGTLSNENIPSGGYSFGGTLYDNAGNSIELTTVGPYKLDCKKPVIEDNTNYSVSGFDESIDFKFTVTEGAEESGVASVKLYLDDGTGNVELKSWGAASDYSYNIVENGKYTIEATDYAGNVNTYEKTVNNLSSEIPDTPVIKVDGTRGNGNWYIQDKPEVTITSQKETSDGVPVTTYYNIITGTKQLEKTATSEDYSFDLNEEGQVTIEAWSVSYSGVSSDKATKTVYVDTDKPDLYITESSADDSGKLIINFKATDAVSGVNTAKVLVNGEPIAVTDNDGVITGSFASDSAKSFEIVTEDIAGNISDTINFVPMRLVASPVMDIQDTSAYISADVYKGTYDIAECGIQYKKASATSYENALANKYDTSFGKNMDYTFRNLTPDTEYDYKIYASTKTSKEVKVIEGKFKTGRNDATGVVYGSVTYDAALTDGAKTYPIYVALYSGNTYIKSAKINDADDNKYKFTDVSDGNYRIVATNGLLSKETSVTVEKGGITYPESYASDGGINFVLSGLSTEVVLEDNAVALSVDGLDKIYNTALYNGNVTDADLDVVAQGGTIKITLYASCIDVNDISDTEETIFEDRLGNEAVIERYINIEIVKEVRDASGNLVNGTPTNITTLAEPVTLSFPLGRLAGQNIHVASLHGSGSDYSFKSWVNGSEAVLSTYYITITSSNFSLYALYRYEVKDVYYTVKWLDGDGNVMKTESVKSGEAATPPTKTPTKTETDKYTYAFESWDTDYSAITGDTIISAWFTANKKDDKKPDDKGGNNSGNNDGNNSGNNSGNNNPDSKTPEANVVPGSGNASNGQKADDITTSPVRYTYMGSASSPKTGDAAPIAAVLALMLSSATGVVILKKKSKENK